MKKIILIIFVLVLCTSCKRSYRGIPSSSSSERTNESAKNPEVQKGANDRYSTKTLSTRSEEISSLFQRLEKSVFMIYGRAGDEVFQASAFLIGPDIGISNFHFLRTDLDDVKAVIQDEVYDLSDFLDYSPTDELDYFIFRIKAYRGTPLTIAKRRPKVGEDVFAIGSPQGLSNSLTKGSISGYRSNSRIQFDATIDHGSSGGPLFNFNGEVVGITSAGADSGKELNFAIDIQSIDLSSFQ